MHQACPDDGSGKKAPLSSIKIAFFSQSANPILFSGADSHLRTDPSGRFDLMATPVNGGFSSRRPVMSTDRTHLHTSTINLRPPPPLSSSETSTKVKCLLSVLTNWSSGRRQRQKKAKQSKPRERADGIGIGPAYRARPQICMKSVSFQLPGHRRTHVTMMLTGKNDYIRIVSDRITSR